MAPDFVNPTHTPCVSAKICSQMKPRGCRVTPVRQRGGVSNQFRPHVPSEWGEGAHSHHTNGNMYHADALRNTSYLMIAKCQND